MDGKNMSLQRVLLLDAWICFLYAAVALLFSAPLAALFFSPTAGPLSTGTGRLRAIGVFVLLMGVYSLWTARAWPRRLSHTRVIMAIEVLWCVACLVLVVAAPAALTPYGVAAVAASGLGVFVFLVGEWLGYRALQSHAPPAC